MYSLMLVLLSRTLSRALNNRNARAINLRKKLFLKDDTCCIYELRGVDERMIDRHPSTPTIENSERSREASRF